MNKFFSSFLSMTLCIISAFCLSSCETDTPNPNDVSNSNTTGVSYGTYIKDLKLAIKKNPTEYIHNRITLKGMIAHQNGETFILDYHNTTTNSLQGHFLGSGLLDKSAFKIVLKNTLENSLLESWDYVELSGTIAISNGKIYLDNCECDILVANEELPPLTG
jgi:hypothetical protein